MPQKKRPQQDTHDSTSDQDESQNPNKRQSPEMSKRRALVVGINDYQGTWNDLPSCVKDAESFKDFLEHNLGFTEIKVLKDKEATLANVQSNLDWLVEDVTANDRLVFFYSGHGATKPNGNIMQEYLNLHDNLLDDNELINRTKDIPQGVFTAIVDCCFSGGIEKRRYEAVVQGFSEKSFGLTTQAPNLSIDRAKVKTFLSNLEQLRKIEEAELNSTFFKPFGQSAKLTPSGYRKATGTTPDEISCSLLNGTLIASCLVDETAVTTTVNTNGLSAFTYALLKVCEHRGIAMPLCELVSLVTLELRRLGLRQTPRVKINPEILLTRTLMNLDHNLIGTSLSNESIQENHLVKAIVNELLTNQTTQKFQGNFPDTATPWRDIMYTQFQSPYTTNNIQGNYPMQQTEFGYQNQMQPQPGTPYGASYPQSPWSQIGMNPNFTQPIHQHYPMQRLPFGISPQYANQSQQQPTNSCFFDSCERITQHVLSSLPIEQKQIHYQSMRNLIPQVVERISRQPILNQAYGRIPLERHQIELTIANVLTSVLQAFKTAEYVNQQFQPAQYGSNNEPITVNHIVSMAIPVIKECIEIERNRLAQLGLAFTAEAVNRLSLQVIGNLSSIAPLHMLQSIVPPIVDGLCKQYCQPVNHPQVAESVTSIGSLVPALV